MAGIDLKGVFPFERQHINQRITQRRVSLWRMIEPSDEHFSLYSYAIYC